MAVRTMARAKAVTARHSDEALIALYLDMLAAERGAGTNTLAAYRRDLEDFSAYLQDNSRSIAKASDRRFARLFERSVTPRHAGDDSGAAAFGDAAALSLSLCRRSSRRRSRRRAAGPQAHAQSAEDAHARRSRSSAAHRRRLRSCSAVAGAAARSAARLPGRVALCDGAARLRACVVAGIGGAQGCACHHRARQRQQRTHGAAQRRGETGDRGLSGARQGRAATRPSRNGCSRRSATAAT